MPKENTRNRDNQSGEFTKNTDKDATTRTKISRKPSVPKAVEAFLKEQGAMGDEGAILSSEELRIFLTKFGNFLLKRKK